MYGENIFVLNFKGTNCNSTQNNLPIERSAFHTETKFQELLDLMMTSSNGNIFRVTGPLWGEPPVTDGFYSQRPVTQRFEVFFDPRMNKRLSKQSRRRWFETPSHSLWCNYNVRARKRFWNSALVINCCDSDTNMQGLLPFTTKPLMLWV